MEQDIAQDRKSINSSNLLSAFLTWWHEVPGINSIMLLHISPQFCLAIIITGYFLTWIPLSGTQN